MKNIFSILAVCFIFSSYSTTLTAQQFNLCAEKQQVADIFKMTFKKIGELATPPTEKDVRELVRVLSKNFNLDESQCNGYTEQVRGASENIIIKRAGEITPTILQICSMATVPEIVDVNLIAAMQEDRIGAKKALIILHESIDECLP